MVIDELKTIVLATFKLLGSKRKKNAVFLEVADRQLLAGGMAGSYLIHVSYAEYVLFTPLLWRVKKVHRFFGREQRASSE